MALIMQNSALVYKYYDLIDGFIRIRVMNPEDSLPGLELENGLTPSRRDYRSYIIKNCVLDLDTEVMPKVHAVYPEDTLAAEDLLYQICIDVNPGLEIHSVALPAEEQENNSEAENEEKEFQTKSELLQKNVLKNLIGQDEAVNKICRTIRKAACGLSDPKRPIGTFMLVGRTGTGKTELAKILSSELFNQNALVRIDCSEYAMAHETAKLIGAPPGYIGHADGGTLTNAIIENQRSVILFDEIEKGHEKLHNMLLQILDDGRLTDSKGTTVDFSKSLILMTSNVGAADYAMASSRLGFGQNQNLSEFDFEDITKSALREKFKPELLNRLDGILTFKSLSLEDCQKIANIQLGHLHKRITNAGVEISWNKHLCRFIAEKGYNQEYGAREIRRAIAHWVEEPLSSLILDGKIKPEEHIKLSARKGNVHFESKKSA